MVNKKIRILMVLNRYYPMIGGAENQCRILMNSLRLMDEVDIVGVVTHKYDDNLSKIDTLDGIQIYRIGKPINKKFSVLSFYVSLFIFLFKKRQQYDILHVHTISLTSFICVLISKLLKKETLQKLTIADEINDIMNKKGIKYFIIKKLVLFSINNGKIVTLTSEGMEEINKYINTEKSNVYKIKNGVDDKIFFKKDVSEIKSKYLIDDNAINLGFVGRLTKQKGILELCKYIIEFNKSSTNLKKLKLYIMGSGNYQIDSVENFIQELSNSNDCIKIILSEHQPVDFYNSIDYYVSNSTKEGMPNTVLEALACRKPLILSAIRPHIEIFNDNKNASIKIYKNKEELFSILNQILINSEIETSEINKDYLINEVAKNYLCIYKGMYIQMRKI